MIFTHETMPFWTAVAAVAAGGSAVMAAFYTFLTFRLVRLQTEPKVIVYTKGDPDRQSILMIIIENIGRDIAYDVTFKASKPIPSRAFGMSIESAKPTKAMDEGPLIEGIPALGPGDCRAITWGQFGGLSKALGDDPIILDYNYRSGKRLIKGQSRPQRNLLLRLPEASKNYQNLRIALSPSYQNYYEKKGKAYSGWRARRPAPLRKGRTQGSLQGIVGGAHPDGGARDF